MPELIVTSAFLRQINDSELDDGELDDGEVDDRAVDYDDEESSLRINKVQQAAIQQYGPLAILPESLTKSQ